MTLNEILLAAIKGMSEEDKAAILDALNQPGMSLPAEDEGPESAGEAAYDGDSGEQPPQPTAEDKKTEDAEAEVKNEGIPDEITTDESAETDDMPIPEMVRGASPPPEEDMSPSEQAASTQPEEQALPLQDEQGGGMPIDYQQIIDGLNAKNLALEAENKRLKARTEAAFGLSSKPGGYAKVNPLYDDDTSDIPPMRRR